LGKPWAWYGALISAAGYVIWYWLDRLFLQQSHSNWLFALGASVIFVFCLGFLLHQKIITYFFNGLSSPFRSFLARKN
jgi:hypothetical protein